MPALRLLPLLALVLLAACGSGDDADPTLLPVDPDLDTAATPAALPNPGRLGDTALTESPLSDTLDLTPIDADEAEAELTEVDGSGVSGTVQLEQVEDGVRVRVRAEGLSEGYHGLRVLADTSCAAIADRAALPFNPEGVPHAAFNADVRPAGSLGNIDQRAAEQARYERIDPVLALRGPNSAVGRVFVLLAEQDDYNTQPDGGAGEPVACGRIEPVSA